MADFKILSINTANGRRFPAFFAAFHGLFVTSIFKNPKPLKKAFTIFFLSIFLFNIGGYYLVYWVANSRAQKDLLVRLDADNYSSNDLVVFSVPISLPYPLQQPGYERVDGEFEYQGEYYSLVKQRLENDTLFMVCIKDHHKKKLVNVLNTYTNLANNLPVSAQHTIALFAKLFKDYTSSGSTAISAGTGWCILLSFVEKEYSLLQRNYPVLSPPPRG
ncbi:MAG TPA: hypothetical protein VIU12_21415 [Chryseolinea sp.]